MARGVLFGIAALAGACVIPVGPKFEDDTNLPPYIVSARPTIGSTASAGPMGEPPTFSVVVADPNVNDTLFVRWIVDYPPFNVNLTGTPASFEVAPTGELTRADAVALRFTPECIFNGITRGLSRHSLTLTVADRPFLLPEEVSSDQGRLDSVGQDGFSVRATWQFDLDCQQR